MRTTSISRAIYFPCSGIEALGKGNLINDLKFLFSLPVVSSYAPPAEQKVIVVRTEVKV